MISEQRTTLSISHSTLEKGSTARFMNTRKQENNIVHRTMGFESRVSEQVATETNNLFAEVKKCHDTITVLNHGVQSLSHDADRLSAESLQQEKLIQSRFSDVNQLKLSISKMDSYLKGIPPNQEMIQQQLLNVKQKVEEVDCSSYDGMLIWRITDISDRMADAQSERQTSVYSPVFYSSPTGYKMRVCLYLHGNGNARGTHMSLSFVLMRGEYDSIVKWPFNHKVTFCVFDQSGQSQHAINSFHPDTISNSFQRPQSEMNIAFGISRFFPLSVIQQEDNSYVRDNTMFLKVIVDFAELPQLVLPYALSMNPGLPSHVQQYMIRQEIQKRQQATIMGAVVPPPTTTASNG
ncbi:unnamed protein product [Didymodactylos carnosus]|uniref:MATH domain-containing protein n=1 Tax=Didymodactylos carnosus TaxID=1234261 RepID=A0A814M058_9BILA|nr:unnamed protein product [Didymodactylos carnosus]CAF1337113.1 unnamed protein product [Didymodactylos carnosus]CAF3838319.1 unnamed protein product [Didymodactylos carnosus]CAF4148475.1 unnamed protein product [Didymodactylos carnosus]